MQIHVKHCTPEQAHVNHALAARQALPRQALTHGQTSGHLSGGRTQSSDNAHIRSQGPTRSSCGFRDTHGDFLPCMSSILGSVPGHISSAHRICSQSSLCDRSRSLTVVHASMNSRRFFSVSHCLRPHPKPSNPKTLNPKPSKLWTLNPKPSKPWTLNPKPSKP